MKKITIEEIDEQLEKLRPFIESKDCKLTFEEFRARLIEQIRELEQL